MAFERPRCPVCQTEFGLFRVAVLRPREGVKCPTCETILKSKLLAREITILVLTMGAVYLAFNYADSQYRSITVLGMFALVLVVLPISLYIAAHFVSFEVPGPNEVVKTDGETESAEMWGQMAQLEKQFENLERPDIIDTDVGEPVHDADRRMANGHYADAFALIEFAIDDEPTRPELKLKLLEILFLWGKSEEFLAFAKKFRSALENSNDWATVRIMGAEICPNERMFS